MSYNFWRIFSHNFEIKHNRYYKIYLTKIISLWLNTLLPTCSKVIYSLSVKTNISILAKLFKGFFYICMTLELSIPCKIVKMLEKWKSVGERFGKYGWWGRISIPKLFNFVCVTLATCGRALSWRRIGPFLLNLHQMLH